MHEPLALLAAHYALGPTDERDGAVVDAMNAALTDPIENVHMGLTVENLGDEIQHHTRGAGRVRGGKSPACTCSD